MYNFAFMYIGAQSHRGHRSLSSLYVRIIAQRGCGGEGKAADISIINQLRSWRPFDKLPSTSSLRQAPFDKLPSTSSLRQAPFDKLPSTSSLRQAPFDKLRANDERAALRQAPFDKLRANDTGNNRKTLEPEAIGRTGADYKGRPGNGAALIVSELVQPLASDGRAAYWPVMEAWSSDGDAGSELVQALSPAALTARTPMMYVLALFAPVSV